MLFCLVAMGKAASAKPKDGYEAVSVVDAADEAQQFLTSSKGTAKPAKTAVPEEMRAWEGRMWHCFGRCDSTGWGACGLSYLLPCVAFGCAPTRRPTLAEIFARLAPAGGLLTESRVGASITACSPSHTTALGGSCVAVAPRTYAARAGSCKSAVVRLLSLDNVT